MLLVIFQVAQCNKPGMGNPRQQRAEAVPGGISSCSGIRTPVLPVLPRNNQIKFTALSPCLAKHINYGPKLSGKLPVAKVKFLVYNFDHCWVSQ